MNVDCQDCGLPDSEMPLDTVLTIKQWEMICPESGMLCASCIVKRAALLPGVMNLTARITFSEDWDDPYPGGRFFQFLKEQDALMDRAAGRDVLVYDATTNTWVPAVPLRSTEWRIATFIRCVLLALRLKYGK